MDAINKDGKKWVAETVVDGELIKSRPFTTKREADAWLERKHVDAKFGDESERLMSAAIIKGIIEHDDGHRFFGSTMNYTYHRDKAVRRGFLLADGSVTTCARDWYDRHLKHLPQGRQVFWKKDLIGLPSIDPEPAPAPSTSSQCADI
jgi:hypothetical protein